jgi:Peptidase M10 serralysin C terminal
MGHKESTGLSMGTIVDQGTAVATVSAFGRGNGPGQMEYVGQTFVAANDFLDAITFYVENYSSGSSAFSYRLLVTTISQTASGFHPGNVIYESATLQGPVSPGPPLQAVTIDTGHLVLQKGQHYAFILDGQTSTTATVDYALGMSFWTPDGGVNYANGNMIALNASLTDTRTTNFASSWGIYDGIADPNLPAADLQFKLNFSGIPPGTASPDNISGTNNPNTLRGLGGNDNLNGRGGNDLIIGGLGRDILTGGTGKDIFDFNSVKETGNTSSTRDVVTDFTHGQDKVDLKDIDANTDKPGNQAFSFIGIHSFDHKPGELLYHKVDNPGTSHDYTLIEIDLNGNGTTDVQIQFAHLINLKAVDFVL